jgi:Fe-Mn family superoxide dismutase
MSFNLPALPYSPSALAPYLSEQTFSFHHGKHHQTYLTNLNVLIVGSGFAKATLEEIVVATAGKPDQVGLFNNAAQAWNHAFFWKSMKPQGGGRPTGEIATLIDKTFGGYEGFAEAFKAAATTQFGSGWAWLMLDKGELKVSKSANADTPLAHGQTALLTLDVWEHAYYLDYQNRRADFVDAFLAHLLNWDFVNANLAKA